MNTAAPCTALVATAVLSLALAACGDPPGDKMAPTKPAAVAETAPAPLPLLVAASSGDLAEAKALLDAGEDINVTDALGRTPLHMAAFYGHPKTSAFLVASRLRL